MAGSIAMSLPPRRKWVIARGMGIDAPFFGLLTLTNFSFACGYFAPISVAGEVLRMGFTKRLLGISYLNSLMLAILDRLFGLAGVMARRLFSFRSSSPADSIRRCSSPKVSVSSRFSPSAPSSLRVAS
jgi:hypothetical protein